MPAANCRRLGSALGYGDARLLERRVNTGKYARANRTAERIRLPKNMSRSAQDLLARLTSTNCELEAALEGQGHGAEPVARIGDEFEVLAIGLAELQCVIAHDDCA